ncbi:hypothetical protein [Aestuariivivens insulae]|uniref:hypothetical protein n=1 Tax=Aestuariivivens insulae TaxID=1621988 RepID=UPI001F568026|nr:hypothetical protein [Aestuariivivens insulae]
MNTVDIINEYDKILDRLADDIKNSNYKLQYFMGLLGLKRGLFYKKMNEKRFTSEEMKKISKYLYPKEFEEHKENTILALLEKSKGQIIKGQTVDFEEVLSAAKKKYDL